MADDIPLQLIEIAFNLIILSNELARSRGTLAYAEIQSYEDRLRRMRETLTTELRKRVRTQHPEWSDVQVNDDAERLYQLCFEEARGIVEEDRRANAARNRNLRAYGGGPNARAEAARRSLVNNGRRVARVRAAREAAAEDIVEPSAKRARINGPVDRVNDNARAAWNALNEVPNRNNRRRRLTRKRNSRASRTHRSRR